jgi:hypothetical protein
MLNNELNAQRVPTRPMCLSRTGNWAVIALTTGKVGRTGTSHPLFFERFFILLHSKRNAVEPPHYKKRISEKIIFLSNTARQSPDCDLIEPFRSISVLNIVSKKCPGRLST